MSVTAIASLEIAVAEHRTAVQVCQALHNVRDQRLLEVPVKLHLVVLKNVLQRAARAVLGDEDGVGGLQACAVEPGQVIVLQRLHKILYNILYLYRL